MMKYRHTKICLKQKTTLRTQIKASFFNDKYDKLNKIFRQISNSKISLK